MTDEEYARYSPWQQQLQNQLNPIGQSHPYNQQPGQPVWSSLDPYQQPPGYSPLSEADVQRIAIAVVARLELLRAAERTVNEPVRPGVRQAITAALEALEEDAPDDALMILRTCLQSL